MILSTQYIEYNNTLFRVKRVLTGSYIKDTSDIPMLREYWHCDRVLKRNDQYFFVQECIDVEDITYELPSS